MNKAWKCIEVNYVCYTGNENEIKPMIRDANMSGDVDWRLGYDTNGNVVISGYNGYHHFSEHVWEGYYIVQSGNDIQICTPKQFTRNYLLHNPWEERGEK